jgi:hypothetical protein
MPFSGEVPRYDKLARNFLDGVGFGYHPVQLKTGSRLRQAQNHNAVLNSSWGG